MTEPSEEMVASIAMGGNQRRGTYFAFQGLLMAVLLLLFLYERRGIPGDVWALRFAVLFGIMGASLVFLRLAPQRTLERWYVQAALFLGDAALASLTLQWTEPDSSLYLIYFLIIFGTALTRSLAQSFAVAVVTSALYLFSAWHPVRGFPHETAFWLRVHFLWVTSSLLAILSRDAQAAQVEQEEQYRERLVQFERMATLGQVAGEVAHRIKGPLTTILVNAEVLSQRLAGQPQTLTELDQIRDEVGHCKEILKNLLDLGRIEEMDSEAFDLREPIDFALKAVEPRFKKHGLRVEVSGLEHSLPVRGDQSLLQEAMTALLHNAVEASRDGGRVRVAARAVNGALWGKAGGAKRSFAVDVEDHGRGIAAKDLERVFQPFFTTKGKEGTGLGLSAALRILQKHGGTIEAESRGHGRGARFTVTIPARERSKRS